MSFSQCSLVTSDTWIVGFCYIWCGVLQYKRTKSLAGESLNTAANTERWMGRHRGFWTLLGAWMCLCVCVESELGSLPWILPYSQQSFHQVVSKYRFFEEGVRLRAWPCNPVDANPSSGLQRAFCQWLETTCCLTIHFLLHSILLLYHINKVNSTTNWA